MSFPTLDSQPESPLDALRASVKTGSSRFAIWGPCVLLAIFFAWASLAELDEVSVAIGEVIPGQHTQFVQHLEGGVIESILVQEGDHVTAGQALMQLNLAGVGINRQELKVRLDGLYLAKARLTSEAQGGDSPPDFPADIKESRPEMVEAELRSFEARRRDLKSSLSVLDERSQQRRLEIAELEAHTNSVRRDLALVQQRLQMSAELLKEGLTPKMEHVQIEGEVEKLKGELSVLQQSVPRAQSALSEIDAERTRVTEQYRRQALEELVSIETRIAELNETLATATDQALRAEIKSPIDGIIKDLRTNTIGGVIRPGEPIAEIVPISNDLEIQAKLDPKDRGFVTAGQRAVVKITTYDYARYGGLEGVVERVSASTSIGPQGQTYYEVVVRTDKTYLGTQEGDFPITPGMEATVDIHTGTRTVLDYMVKPVLKLQHEAFRER
ncbi:MAG: HlyD family type I secretion periplasmic adaptor subunit [Alphaproteobacteria bacterium]|nr:HlyD family type I secretion periplasmic adaptor subunit [Alphaproteobacteria bacterium]